MRLTSIASPLLLVLAACGGTSSTIAADDAGTDATSATDAGSDVVTHPEPDAGADVVTHPEPDAGADGATKPDGSAACRTEAPTYHRPSATTCPSHATDAGTDSGIVGCMPPHDACLVDTDCGGSGVCDCETPSCAHPFGSSGNVCLPGNCRVDSDCACGFCAGDPSCGGLDGYWCTTPLDECSTDADCHDGGASSQCRWSTDHWACASALACPG
jgi:hypothetical protein